MKSRIHSQKGDALLLLLVALVLFFPLLRYLDSQYPCGLDPVERARCEQEQGK